MKKVKQKTPRTTQQKEDLFVKIGTKILIVVCIIVAIVYAIKSVGDTLKVSDLKLVEELSKEVDISLIVTNPIESDDETSLYAKISASGLDILDENVISYEKYNRTNISITSGVTFSANEFALLYNALFFDHPDKYNTTLKQLDFFSIDGGYKIRCVSAMDLNKLLPSLDTGTGLKIYVVNECEIKNGVITPIKTAFNNMSDELCSQLVSSINSQDTINIEKYVASQITRFADTLATRINCNTAIADGTISFTPKTA